MRVYKSSEPQQLSQQTHFIYTSLSGCGVESWWIIILNICAVGCFHARSPKLSHLLLTTTCWDGQSWYFYFQLTGLVHQTFIDQFVYTWPDAGQGGSLGEGGTVFTLKLFSLVGNTETATHERVMWWAVWELAGTNYYRHPEGGVERTGRKRCRWGPQRTRSWARALLLHVVSMDHQFLRSRGAWQKCRISGPTRDPLIQNPYFHRTFGTPLGPLKVEEHETRWFTYFISFTTQWSRCLPHVIAKRGICLILSRHTALSRSWNLNTGPKDSRPHSLLCTVSYSPPRVSGKLWREDGLSQLSCLRLKWPGLHPHRAQSPDAQEGRDLRWRGSLQLGTPWERKLPGDRGVAHPCLFIFPSSAFLSPHW